MAVTAVTGEIGAGKSTVSSILARLTGCVLIDADKVAAEIWTSPDVKGVFASRWGNDILDAHGEIIKAEISRRVHGGKECGSYGGYGGYRGNRSW